MHSCIDNEWFLEIFNLTRLILYVLCLSSLWMNKGVVIIIMRKSSIYWWSNSFEWRWCIIWVVYYQQNGSNHKNRPIDSTNEMPTFKTHLTNDEECRFQRTVIVFGNAFKEWVHFILLNNFENRCNCKTLYDMELCFNWSARCESISHNFRCSTDIFTWLHKIETCLSVIFVSEVT